MQKEFRETLQKKFGDIAKNQLTVKKGSDEAKQLEIDLNQAIGEAVKTRQSDPEAQERIFSLQKKKQRVMQEFKTALALLDGPLEEIEQPKGATKVVMRNGRYIASPDYGEEQEITLGQLLTDGEWGIRYFPDPLSVPRAVCKRYLIEDAKRQIQQYADKQILEDELASAMTLPARKETYKAIKAEQEAGIEWEGLIAEKMVRGFMQKIAIDYRLPFEILKIDLFLDVDRKIDFLIRREDYERGATVETVADMPNVGIQFTISKRLSHIKSKERQITKAKTRLTPEERIRDIVLVAIPLDRSWQMYENWKDERTAGGPDDRWDPEVKERIFRGVLRDMFSPEEIEEMWKIVSPPPAQEIEEAA